MLKEKEKTTGTNGKQNISILTFIFPILKSIKWRRIFQEKTDAYHESESHSVVTKCNPMDYTVHGIL